MDDITKVIIILSMGIFVAGTFIGIEAGKSSVSKDCETLGKFRYGSTVYECAVKK